VTQMIDDKLDQKMLSAHAPFDDDIPF